MAKKISISDKHLHKLSAYGVKKDCAEKTGLRLKKISKILTLGTAPATEITLLRKYIDGRCSKIFLDPVA